MDKLSSYFQECEQLVPNGQDTYNFFLNFLCIYIFCFRSISLKFKTHGVAFVIEWEITYPIVWEKNATIRLQAFILKHFYFVTDCISNLVVQKEILFSHWEIHRNNCLNYSSIAFGFVSILQNSLLQERKRIMIKII